MLISAAAPWAPCAWVRLREERSASPSATADTPAADVATSRAHRPMSRTVPATLSTKRLNAPDSWPTSSGRESSMRWVRSPSPSAISAMRSRRRSSGAVSRRPTQYETSPPRTAMTRAAMTRATTMDERPSASESTGPAKSRSRATVAITQSHGA